MTSVLLTCPYCNAQVAVPSVQEGMRVTCPRCDESFPASTAAAVETAAMPAQPAPPPRPQLPMRLVVQILLLSLGVGLASLILKLTLPESTTTQKAFPFMMLVAAAGLVASLWLWFFTAPHSNRAVAGFVLGNMVCIALLILPFALGTTNFRRRNDPQPVPPLPEPVAKKNATEPVAPGQLPALGYLPDNCNVVAGIHVAELYQLPIGAELFGKRNTEVPGETVPAPWLIDQGLGRVELWTGLKAEAIDHIVFGLRVDGKLPHLTIVVRTRKPYDPALVAAKQGKTVPLTLFRKNDLYQFRTPPIGNGILWLANEQTLVLVWRLDAMTDQDRLALKAEPRQGADAPPPLVRKVLAERLRAGTLIWWAAVDLEQPELVASLLPAAGKNEELAKLLKKVHTLTAGLRLQKEDAAVLANVECPDVATARRMAELLQQLAIPGLSKPTVSGPAPDGSDTWVLLQMRGSPEAVVQALQPVRLFARPGGK